VTHSSKYDYDLIVVGGGIVGLATGYQFLKKNPGHKLLVLEKETELAQHQTGRNSGVIHSGLYYQPGSLKAKNCLDGYSALLKFCEQESIPHDVCGKVVVATTQEEITTLDTLFERGTANGLQGIKILEPEEIKEKEPYCTAGLKGLWVPQTGIVDYLAVANAYAKIITEQGGDIILGACVSDIKSISNKAEISTDSKSWTAKAAVICAGLQADRLAKKTEANLPLQILPVRGEYYELTEQSAGLVKNLIYPVPDPAFPFLGVHFTRMIQGGIECGPNAVFAFGREAYNKSEINISDTLESLQWPGLWKIAAKHWKIQAGEFYRSYRKKAFVSSLQKLIPSITTNDVVAGTPGIRAQALDRNGDLLDDFNFRYSGNIIHVCNAPSPAATASLSIGKTIVDRLSIIID
jgi:(S)-2-hydroxyglutarate dehydrogenase